MKHKNTQTFQTQINKNKPPHKAPKPGETKENIFNTPATLPDKKHNHIKAWKNKQKHSFAMFKNNPQFFINFLYFWSKYSICIATAVCYWKHFKKRAFRKTQPFKSTVSKTHFFHPCQKTFSKKRCHFWYWAISAETTILMCFLLYTVLDPKKFLAKTDSVHENASFISLPDTNSVRQFLLKNPFLFFTFLDDHL